MDDYVERTVNDLPIKIRKSNTALTPARNNLFEKFNRKTLGKKETEQFHT